MYDANIEPRKERMEQRGNWLGLAGYRNGTELTGYAGNAREWARGEVNAIRAAKGLKPMAWPEGGDVAIRYCVTCLKDESRVQATHISEGAGYCFPCARERKAQGNVVYTISEWARQELGESRRRKLGARKYVRVTPEMRRHIIAHPEVAATKMAAKFGISAQTVHNVWAASNEAMEHAVKDLDVPRSGEQMLAAAVAEQGPEAVEEAIEVPVEEGTPEFDEETPVFLLEREVPVEEIRNMYPGLIVPLRGAQERAAEVVPADVPAEAPEPTDEAVADFPEPLSAAINLMDTYLRGVDVPPAEPEPVSRDKDIPAPCVPKSSFVQIPLDPDATCVEWRPEMSYFETENTARPVEDVEPVSRNREALRRVMEEGLEPDVVAITLNLTHETANAIWGGLSLEEKATFCRTKIIERLEMMA